MLRRIASAALALSLACSAHGQSDPSGFATVINFPGDTIPTKINGGTQLNIFDGATDIPSIFVDEEFTSGGFSEANFYGGEMTRNTFVRATPRLTCSVEQSSAPTNRATAATSTSPAA